MLPICWDAVEARQQQRRCHRAGWRTQWAEGPLKDLMNTGNDSLVSQEEERRKKRKESTGRIRMGFL